MARLPYAAKQFLAEAAEVLGIEPEVEFQDEDGLRVYRTLRFEKDESEALAPALEHIEDARILEHHITEAGYLYVQFTAGNEADERHEFLLADAATVARGSESEPEPEPEPKPRKTRKKAQSGDDAE